MKNIEYKLLSLSLRLKLQGFKPTLVEKFETLRGFEFDLT